MPSRYGHTLSDSRLDFEILTQSEAREPPTSGWESVMEGHAMVLIVSIALSYTYTMVKHQYPRKESDACLRAMAIQLSDSRLDFENLTQSEAREPSTSGWESVMEGHAMVLIVSIALSYTYTMVKHQYPRKRVMHAFALWPYIVRQPARFRNSDPI